MVAIIDSWQTESYTQVVKYYTACFDFTNIFLIASIVILTVGSGYLARAGLRYSNAAKDDPISQEFAACSGCMDNNHIMDAYTESLRGKMQGSLQNMIFRAGIGIALLSMGAGFSMAHVKWYRKTEAIL